MRFHPVSILFLKRHRYFPVSSFGSFGEPFRKRKAASISIVLLQDLTLNSFDDVPSIVDVKSVTFLLEVKLMPVKNPRINVVLEKPLYHVIERLASKDGVSLSLKVRDPVKEALEIEEDIALSAFAEKRERTFMKTKALKHHEVW